MSASIPARLPALPGEAIGAAMGAMMEMVLGGRLVFAEHLDAEALKRATRLLLDLEPVLGCWYEPGRGGTWVRCDSLDTDIPFTLHELRDGADDHAATFHVTPFLERGPRLAVLLLRLPDHDEVCFRVDHVAVDGWSAKEIAHLLAELYTAALADPAYAPEPRVEDRPSHEAIWAALTDEQRAAAQNTPPFTPSKWKLKVPHGRSDAFHTHATQLSPALVAGVRAYAHERNATVNEALLAALVRGVSLTLPSAKPTQPGFSISADTRRLTPNGSFNRLGMVATSQNVVIDYRHGEPFEETLRHVAEAVSPHRQALWSVKGSGTPMPIGLARAGFGMLTSIARLMSYTGGLDMNLGAYDEERLAFGDVRPVSVVATGPLCRFPSFPITVSSYRETMTLWTGYRENTVRPDVMQRVHAETEAQLAAVGGSA
jgi:NRPS condensation-like uncharacterized protein